MYSTTRGYFKLLRKIFNTNKSNSFTNKPFNRL